MPSCFLSFFFFFSLSFIFLINFLNPTIRGRWQREVSSLRSPRRAECPAPCSVGGRGAGGSADVSPPQVPWEPQESRVPGRWPRFRAAALRLSLLTLVPRGLERPVTGTCLQKGLREGLQLPRSDIQARNMHQFLVVIVRCSLLRILNNH